MTASPVTPDQLTQDFPEFRSAAYPDSTIQFWLNVAYLRLPATLWNNAGLLDLGAELFACHEIVLEKRASDEAANGAPPGETVGAPSSRSVDKVSIGYDTASTSEEGAGYYNQTIYGKRFWKLLDAVGSTGITLVGAPNCQTGVVLY